jgi:hypothetical protein
MPSAQVSLLSIFRMLFASHQGPTLPPVAFDASGFRLGTDELAWSNVLTIVAYKVDLFTVDEINVEFTHANGVLVVTEENPGFAEFMDEVVNRFPTALGWYSKVSQPAFATCTTVLYEKAADASHI